MKHFSAGIDIEAAPEAVWATLVDLARWPRFDRFTERIEGLAALGETVKIFTTLAPGRAFPVKITTLERPAVMAWVGGMSLGALKIVRTHTITPRHGGSRLEIEEVVSGPMLGMIANSLPNLTALFTAFCSGLKAQVEGTPAKDADGEAAAAGAPQRVLRMTRRFRAAPERVFDAWVKPETASQWLFHMPGDESYSAQLDARVGGQWTITARGGGVEFVGEGEYLEIDRPRRLVFTFQMQQFSPNTDTITVELEPDGDGCRLTLTQAGVDIGAELAHVAPGEAGGTEKGWRAMLDKLAQWVD